MQAFQVHYRNTQGTLMRILNAVSRRGLDLPSVHAEAAEQDHRVTLLLDATPKQSGQLQREWYSIVDVTSVYSSSHLHEQRDQADTYAAPHPPASAKTVGESAHAATA